MARTHVPTVALAASRQEHSAQPGVENTDIGCTRMIRVLAKKLNHLEADVSKTNLKWLACLLVLGVPTLAQAECMSNLSQVKANNVKTYWQEATANDGKPMTISINDGANGLVYSAKKAGVTWLTGNVSVCKSGGSTDITLKNTKATNNVPMLAKLGMPATQSGQIVSDQIKLAGGGWSGTFIGL